MRSTCNAVDLPATESATAQAAVPDHASQPDDAAKVAANEQVVLAFMKDVFDEHHGDHAARYLTDDMQWHGGTVGTVAGRFWALSAPASPCSGMARSGPAKDRRTAAVEQLEDGAAEHLLVLRADALGPHPSLTVTRPAASMAKKPTGACANSAFCASRHLASASLRSCNGVSRVNNKT